MLWWLSLVTASHSQGIGSNSVWTAPVPCHVDGCTICCISQVFPKAHIFLEFPTHTAKPGDVQLWCRALSLARMALSQQVGLVFGLQKTGSLPLLSRPVIPSVYEGISPPSSISTQHRHKHFYDPYLAPGLLVLYFRTSPFLSALLMVTLHALEYGKYAQSDYLMNKINL